MGKGKNVSSPQGWDSFAQVLRDIKTPRERVGDKDRGNRVKIEKYIASLMKSQSLLNVPHVYQ